MADDHAVRETLQRCLVALGHEVLAVGGGRALLDACAAASPDVVVSDVQMPDPDGITAAEVIRRAGATPVGRPAVREPGPAGPRAAAIPAVWCLAKPVPLRELACAVEAAVGVTAAL